MTDELQSIGSRFYFAETGVEVPAILAGIVALAAAIAAMPKIWVFLKNLWKFALGIEQITALPQLVVDSKEHTDRHNEVIESLAEVANSIAALSQDLRDHMNEEERMRNEEKRMVESMVESIETFAERLSKHVLDVADVVFRQAVFADPVAYYILKKDEANNKWVWTWGNASYHKLTGLSPLQSQGGQYWSSVAREDYERVHAAAIDAAANGLPLELEYVNVNAKTGERTPVRVLSWPMVDSDGMKPVGYLGSIRVVNDIDNVDYV